MLKVDDYELIRRKHLVDDLSQREIARELGCARNTVAKAIKHPIPPGYQLSQPRAKPKIDAVKPIIDAWLEVDRTSCRSRKLYPACFALGEREFGSTTSWTKPMQATDFGWTRR